VPRFDGTILCTRATLPSLPLLDFHDFYLGVGAFDIHLVGLFPSYTENWGVPDLLRRFYFVC
jgi:hypothetical protein